MTVRIGILGLGFMGKMHFDTYRNIRGAKVVAIADPDPKKRAGAWGAIGGNIGDGGGTVDLSGVATYANPEGVFADANVDVVDITLPTHLHASAATAALKAGKHVFCEKPMARTSSEGRRMIAAAKKADRLLFVAQCIRFWPAYAKVRSLLQSGRYGKLLSLNMSRLSPAPTWSWKDWLSNPKLSGSALLDLHIHDSDWLLHTLGMPKKVTCHAGGFRGRADHVMTHFQYGKGQLVTAEGGWAYAPDFPFRMLLSASLEKASIELLVDGTLNVYPAKGGVKTLKVVAGDGYFHELKHFVRCVKQGTASEVVPPESALDSLRLIEAEQKSAASGKAVALR